VNPVTVNVGKKKYPYSKNRVYLSTTIAVLSLLLAGTLFQTDPTSVLPNLLYFLLSSFAVTIATFLLKMRLYPLITEGFSTTEQPRGQTETSGLTWKMLLLVFCMLVAPILVPLLLAGVLGGPGWFILITSYILGVSISEILFYVYTR